MKKNECRNFVKTQKCCVYNKLNGSVNFTYELDILYVTKFSTVKFLHDLLLHVNTKKKIRLRHSCDFIVRFLKLYIVSQ